VSYLLLKTLHIISAAVLLGTGAGIAFFMFMAHRSRDLQALRVATRHVVLADWLFTAPAVVLQPLTGLMLMSQLGWPILPMGRWLHAVLGLYVMVGCCWVPVVWIQHRLAQRAAAAVEWTALDAAYWRLYRLWLILGVPAFAGVLALVWLMVAKPWI
jgi:uncharacterized membrane protein